MSLAEKSQKWFPTHVQATVLQARDLHPKGKNGTNDTYTIIQLGKEKYSTSVAEKTLSPVWKEEASFELPGLLLEGNPETYTLNLIVMHRSLVGLDKFLGQVSISLNEIFDNKERRKIDWFKLESKPGKKGKDRGQIQVNIQFMRHNMTASMFDLSMKDKPRSPFSKFKDKMKRGKGDGTFSDTSSAILPTTSTPRSSDPDISEMNQHMKPKPKRTYLLGPQRLSAAHSMSDLIGSHFSGDKVKASTIGHAPLFRPKLDSMNSIDESGNVISPHKRSQSVDTANPEQPGSASTESEGGYEGHSDLFANISDSLPQKSATLPRNKNPFESSSGVAWEGRTNIRSENKKEKKEKVGLLERVKGKKDGKKLDKISNGKSGSSGDLRSPNPFSDNLQGDAGTNPFSTNYKSKTSSNLMKPSSIEDIKKALTSNRHSAPNSNAYPRDEAKEGNSFNSVASYRNLSFEEVVQELVKQKELVKKKDAHIRELEDYIDGLLVKVMEETPSILRVPYELAKKAGKFSKQ
ncbi:rab11 family-interacting protein 2-like [Acipenser oxyrinchus oxyrinchus]|uniref:Rab11 family-interacting protein 2 n=1 Tax=Acipenser oxyrinchus oxyrinchus TaxID=40147 RepID=A0AAD8D6Y6_ACIOX|nr:rab11 family-interacting protein 2-like [Acipenser oxyrinchus oxyrinchus]